MRPHYSFKETIIMFEFARLAVQHLSDPVLRAQLKADIKHDFANKKANKNR